MPRTDVPQRELRGLTPHDITQHYASERVTAFQNGGSPAHHVSSDPTDPRRPRGQTRRTRSMEVHAQTLPSSSQPPEVAAMERQVRDLTANLQELTRQNQILNQRLQQHETEKQKEKDKGKNKERGDAESRQERQQEQQQEQQEQRQEQEGETRGENTRITVEQPSAKWEEEIKAMRAQMGEMKDEFKGRATKNIDDLVQGTDSPFTEKESQTRLCAVLFQPPLRVPARIWFKKLMPGSVGSFAQLSRLFFNHFIGGQRYGRPTTHLLNVKQKEGETLRSYLTRFNKETLLVDGADDKVVLTAFISGLQSGDFLFSVYKDPPSTMTEMMYEAQRYMNGEEALLARDQATGKKRKGDHADRPAEPHETRPKAQRNRNGRQEDRSGRGFNERFNRFTPLNAPVDHIFMQIRNDPALKWPGKLLTDPDKRPRDKYCRFHRDHGHNTENCYDLKRQIEELIKQGKLQRFIEKGQREGRPQGARQQRPPEEAPPRPPLGEIHKSNKKPRVEDLPITFTEEDACKVFHPHDDALVVTMEIAGYSTRRVLIDNGSSADIIYLTAFQQMKIDKDQLQPIETPLVGFAGTSIYPLGMVTLQIIAGTHPKQAMKKVNFLVVDCPSAYNVIIGRPTLNRLQAVTSTYHLLVRFPTENGIGEMKGDQAMARECYLTTVNAEQVHQTLIMEERKNIAEPTEELEEIVLIEGDEKKTTRIGTSMAKEIRASVVSFLRGNADVFAWSHDDMPGISTEVISHKLERQPFHTPRQAEETGLRPGKKHCCDGRVLPKYQPKRGGDLGFIREVYYLEWLANVVMVKKSTGKWRMCVDFTDLNKACPKDSYPLPRIDQLVDSTAGHKLLSFMDAFSGYNQIQMTEGDQEKTAFITSRGLFCYKVMPFGLKNAGATYQRLVNKMFHDQIGRNVEVYVDDMLVKSKKDEDHLIDLKETFQTLRRYNMKLNPAKCVFGVSSGKFLGFMVSQRGIEANPDKIKAILDMSPPKTIKEVQSLTGKAAALNSPSQTGEELYLYLAVSASAVSFALIREEERVQKPVYYTSRALRGAEERYSNMEKLAFALLIASRKLRPYFQSHPIVVLTDYPLRKAMNKPDAAGRLVQWSIEMSEFHIDYRPRTAIKAQALADFIAEFTQPWKDEEDSEEGKAWTVNIDGSSTKEMSGAGVVLVSPEKDKFEYALQLRFRATNNEAEYEALLAGLKLSKSMGIEEPDRQKRFSVNRRASQGGIPREENEAADRLARLASSGVEIDGFVEIQGRPSTEEETINPISFTTTWMLPIIRYLKEGTLPADRAEAHKLRIRASRFQLLGGILYKMGFSRPHLRCLSPEEANYVIREVHEGVCGNHSRARSLAHKLTRAGYYWPSLLHDATQFVKACDKCQRFANVPRVPPEEFTPITSPWPFAQWGLDIMGPFPVGTKQAKFLVVAIDYFTKWVEAEPLATISEKNVKSFVWKAVICRFGIPRVLISDNGKQFDNGPFRELCAQLNIRNHYSSPRHPQANGQVEVTNRTLLKQIKTRLEGAKGMWVEELPSVLWAYRTTVRTPTKETPFKLTYGTEAVIPVEIGLTTLRTTFHNEGENEGQLRLNLDLLDEARERAARRIALYQGKMARRHLNKSDTHEVHKSDTFTRCTSQTPTRCTSQTPTRCKSDTHEVHKSDTHEVHKLDTFKVHELDTHEVQVRHPRGAPVRHLQGAPVRHPRGAGTMEAHQENCSPTSQPTLDTQGVHPEKKTVKSVPSLPIIKEEDRQECPFSTYYQVRHPRGASREEDRQECPFSIYYQVRHPRGASREEDPPFSKSVPSLDIIKRDTQGVHLKRKPVKDVPSLPI
uniref:RNA-directed DNA polymerase n=1 Tax=Fagus sylvatica TaxID=28930 RepID=A0A2N9GJ57_FAGSY